MATFLPQHPDRFSKFLSENPEAVQFVAHLLQFCQTQSFEADTFLHTLLSENHPEVYKAVVRG